MSPRLLQLGLAVTFLLILAPAALQAAAPEPCSCEYCLENLDAKCRPPDGSGVASCSALVRSGACLGQAATQAPPEADAGTSPAPEPPVLYEPLFTATECCTSKQAVDCRKQ